MRREKKVLTSPEPCQSLITPADQFAYVPFLTCPYPFVIQLSDCTSPPRFGHFDNHLTMAGEVEANSTSILAS